MSYYDVTSTEELMHLLMAMRDYSAKISAMFPDTPMQETVDQIVTELEEAWDYTKH